MLKLKQPRGRWMMAALLLGIGLAVVSLLTALRMERPSLPSAFRYRFPEALSLRAATRTAAFSHELAFLQERVNRYPDSGLDLAGLAGAYVAKARVTGQNSWYILGQQAAERSLALLPLALNNSAAQLTLAEVAQARHDFAGALALISEVTRTQPNNASAVSLRATIELALGEPAAARRDVDTLVTALPNVSNLTLRATALEAQGQLTAARADFEHALSIEEPDDPFGSAHTRTLFARFLMRHGEYTLARGLLDEALQIAPLYPLALLHLADLNVREGRDAQAEANYGQLLILSRGTPSTYDHAAQQGLARIKQSQGSSEADALWNTAEATLRREIEQGAFGHRRELARLLLERGRPGDIAEALDQATREVSVRHDWETLSALAWAQLRAGQAPAARITVQRALRSGIQDAELMDRAAKIERKLGHPEQAQRDEAAALRIDPQFSPLMRERYGLVDR